MKTIAALSMFALVTGVPVLMAQATSAVSPNDRKAEEEVRRLNDEEVKRFCKKTQKLWHACGQMILSSRIH